MDKVAKKINKVLGEAWVDGNFESIKNVLSFDERKRILIEGDDNYPLSYLCFSEVYSNLFTTDEAEALYVTLTSEEYKDRLLVSCSDDLKLKKINTFNGNVLNYISSFKDDDKKLQAFVFFLNNGKIVSSNLAEIIKEFDGVYFDILIDKICKCDGGNAKIKMDLDTIAKILALLPIDSREVLFDKLLKFVVDGVGEKKVSSIGLERLLEKFPTDKYSDILKKFSSLSDNGKFDMYGFTISSVLKSVGDKKINLLKNLINDGVFLRVSILYKVFEVLSDTEKDLVLQQCFEYNDKNGTKMLSILDIANIIMFYSNEKRIEVFKRIVLNDNRYNPTSVIGRIDDVDFKFQFLNIYFNELFSNRDLEDKPKIFQKLFNVVSGYGDKVPKGDVIYPDVVNVFSESLAIDRDNLIKFIEKFGYICLRYLDNDNIKKVINLDNNKFNSFMELFKDDNLRLDNDTFNNVINAILQREFMVQCEDDYNIFSRLEELINKSSVDDVEKIILNMSSVINIKKVLNKYNVEMNFFIRDLLDGNSEMLDILHEITNQYIMKKRELYVNNRMLYVNEELDLDKKYEKTFIKKKWIATSSEFSIVWAITYDINENDLNLIQKELRDNEKILKGIISFKKEPKSYKLDDSYKKYLKVFDSLVDILYDTNKLKDPTDDPNAKYVYFTKEVLLESLVDFISDLDIDKLDKSLLCDNNKLDSLKVILSKYKLLGWGNTFSNLRESADFEFSNNTLVGLFNYFYEIDSELMSDERFSLTKMISLANCYASSSSKYGLLFGNDVFRLISANEGKNKASMIKHKRLELGSGHVVGMYNREKVPVPSMDENFIIDNGKELNVVVGNTTDMRNLVLGELTNSCLRIGGVFYDLYKECLEGENGFHIVFSVPGTDKFISRVSGIRNGNTLFLNELRNSECKGYDNDDVVSAIKKVANMLVERSKFSEFPIDNVVITADYAMEVYKNELIKLNLSDRDEALYGLNHNLTKEGEAILLASSCAGDKLVDVELGKDKISYYKPQRGKIKEYVGLSAAVRVVQLEGIINNLLNGESLADINLEVNKDIVRCVSGEDWFIAIDSKGNLRKFILDKSRDNDIAMAEMANCMNIISSNSIDDRKGVIK